MCYKSERKTAVHHKVWLNVTKWHWFALRDYYLSTQKKLVTKAPQKWHFTKHGTSNVAVSVLDTRPMVVPAWHTSKPVVHGTRRAVTPLGHW